MTSSFSRVARLHRMGVDPLWNVYIYQDLKYSDRYALYLYQGGLGLPNRDYYVDDDARSVALRSAYVEHVGNVLGLLGESPEAARRDAESVMALDSELAGASCKLAALRDVDANYNPFDIGRLLDLAPAVTWSAYFAARGLPVLDSVIVGQPEFFTLNGSSCAFLAHNSVIVESIQGDR